MTEGKPTDWDEFLSENASGYVIFFSIVFLMALADGHMEGICLSAFCLFMPLIIPKKLWIMKLDKYFLYN